MTKDQMMPKYEAGERTCPICGEPLPAHQTWIGANRGIDHAGHFGIDTELAVAGAEIFQITAL